MLEIFDILVIQPYLLRIIGPSILDMGTGWRNPVHCTSGTESDSRSGTRLPLAGKIEDIGTTSVARAMKRRQIPFAHLLNH